VPVYVALQLIGDEESETAPPFNSRTKNTLLGFLRILNENIEARASMDLGELMDFIFGRVDFEVALLREYGEEEGRDRWNNVQELRNVAIGYGNLPRESQLPTFLEEVALVSDLDSVHENRDSITCITLHQAKGLEYPIVFLIGLEEGLLPHSRSLDDVEALDEERRLFYVGATRAKQRLYMLYAFRRTTYGRTNISQPSRFLADIPKDMLKQMPKRGHAPVEQTSMFSSRSNLGGLGGFGGGSARMSGVGSRASTTQSPRPTVVPSGPKEAAFFAGQKVKHATFGEGVVVSSKMVENDEEVTVAFTGKGVKRLLASFAKLERVE
jgi:DNA helicase-2/ATP-dependent DNA helicase PcrA